MKEPASHQWRFVAQGTSHLVIPPGIAQPNRTQIRVSAATTTRNRACRGLMTVDSTSLSARPQGWLTAWADDLVARQCVPPRDASVLAATVTESLALDPSLAFRVQYPDEIVPPQKLQVVSPILRDQTKEEEPVIVNTEGTSSGLNLTLKTSDNFIGFETALYSIEPRPDGNGYSISPLYSDRTISGKVERLAQPSTNYLGFPADAHYFRAFVKSGETAFTALVLAASTRADLMRAVETLNRGTGTCADIAAGYCLAIPKRVALNAVIPIKMNNADVMIRWGADLGEALRTAGVRQPEAALAGLSIERSYRGRLTPISFDPADRAVLKLPLTGTERITWTTTQ